MDDSRSEFRCPECNKAFKRAAILRDHLRGHRNEKPFECGTCHKAFTRRNDMKRHEDTHLEKQFGCNMCGKQFTRQLALTRHTRMHDQSRPYIHTRTAEQEPFDIEEDAQDVYTSAPAPSQSGSIAHSIQESSDLPGLSEPPVSDSSLRELFSKQMKVTHDSNPQSLALSKAFEEHEEAYQTLVEMDRLHGPSTRVSDADRDRSADTSSTSNVALAQGVITRKEHTSDDIEDSGEAFSLNSHPVSDLALVLAQNTLEETLVPQSPDWSSFDTFLQGEQNDMDITTSSDESETQHNPGDLQPYAFPCLQHTFNTMDKLRQHLWEEHTANLNTLALPSLVGSTKLGFVCYLHGGNTRSELVDHCELEHRVHGDESNYLAEPSDTLLNRVTREEHRFIDDIGEDYLSDEEEDDESDVYFCEVCPAEYESRASFARHLVSHLENVHKQPYRCRQCDLSFSFESDYNEHRISQPHVVVRSLHWVPEIFCPFKCGEVFTNVVVRNEHARARGTSVCKNRLQKEENAWSTALKQLGNLSAQLNMQLEFQWTIDKINSVASRDLAIKMILANISKWVD